MIELFSEHALLNVLRDLNGLLAAGIAITAFSLLLYALSFNLRDRVARSLTIILACVLIVFVGESLSSVAGQPRQLEFWLRLQWVGIIFMPAAYMQFSDALLATTGQPSRGRRRLVTRLLYLVSTGFLLILPTDLLAGPLIHDASPAPHLGRTWLTWIFAAYYGISMLLAVYNFARAYGRTVTSTSRRRMTYLLVGALAPALGSYPYLLFGSNVAAQHQLFFWVAVTLTNLMVSVLLVLMAYAVAFFGVPWPDRVVKRRLFKWLMRGPVTASTVLAVTTFLRRSGNLLGLDLSAVIPAVMVGLILVMEHLITLAAPVWERRLFYGKDRADIDLLQALDERLLTLGDLQQFLESILAAVCDRLQVSQAFIAALGAQGLEVLVTIGGDQTLELEGLPGTLLRGPHEAQEVHETIEGTGAVDLPATEAGISAAGSYAAQNGKDGRNKPYMILTWGDYWLVPLHNSDETAPAAGAKYPAASNELLGILGVLRKPGQELDIEQEEALSILVDRAALAIRDRSRQQQTFSSLEELATQMDMIQRLRAAARYDGTEILTTPQQSLDLVHLEQSNLSPWVKDALTHYWGGPKLTQNPLLDLEVVQQTAKEQHENSINALRAILRQAIENVRPEGERRFTAEWILYNILSMKFMEGRKVREIASRLAVSEADLYRKQRVAIEAVANAVIEMEQEARQKAPLQAETSLGTEKKLINHKQPGTSKVSIGEVELNGKQTALPRSR
jgi:hypothetical protein